MTFLKGGAPALPKKFFGTSEDVPSSFVSLFQQASFA
jgi:hypothetical protein